MATYNLVACVLLNVEVCCHSHKLSSVVGKAKTCMLSNKQISKSLVV